MTERPALTESELVELVRSADLRAPDSLHRSVESLVAGRARREPRLSGARRRWNPRGLAEARRSVVATALVAALALALVVSLSGGGGSQSSLREASTLRLASALTLRAATVPAPRESSSKPAELAAAVDGVSFPYWRDHFGWRSTGSRTDRIGGRAVTTVFYADAQGRRIGYAIVAGVQAHPPSGGVTSLRAGTAFRVLTLNGATVVTWLRDGHLCVVSGRGVDGATLLRLASWGESSSNQASPTSQASPT
jgi:hypothetical protein